MSQEVRIKGDRISGLVHPKKKPITRVKQPIDPSHWSGQIIATSHDLGPQKVAQEGKSPYIREI